MSIKVFLSIITISTLLLSGCNKSKTVYLPSNGTRSYTICEKKDSFIFKQELYCNKESFDKTFYLQNGEYYVDTYFENYPSKRTLFMSNKRELDTIVDDSRMSKGGKIIIHRISPQMIYSAYLKLVEREWILMYGFYYDNNYKIKYVDIINALTLYTIDGKDISADSLWYII